MPDREAAASLPFLPYGRQEIGDADIKAVVEALVSGWLTTGPRVPEFEQAFAGHCGAREGVAVNSGTAALHAAMRVIGVRTGDEVIVPALTFAASANAAIYEGASPVFADVEEDTLLIDVASVKRRITPRTRAIVTVDYAGQPADYDALRQIARSRGIRLIADACHAPGATYNGRKVGTLGDISCFSFHPVKHMTTCEGGMCTTDDDPKWPRICAASATMASTATIARARPRAPMPTTWPSWATIIACRMCSAPWVMAQLPRLNGWVVARQKIARFYDQAFAGLPQVTPLRTHADRSNAYHLYVVRLAAARP